MWSSTAGIPTSLIFAPNSTRASRAARLGATVAFLPELTLSRYPADTLPENDTSRLGAMRARPSDLAEDLLTGPTFRFAAEAARRHGICIHASLYQRADHPDGSDDGLGLNTAILVSPAGELLARTHKLHIPKTAGYYEDKFFRPGPASADAYEVHAPAELGGARLGMPTCWDEWFPEVARLYSLGGAELLVYPPPSARSPTILTSTPSRSGSRSLSATASPTVSSWSRPTAGGTRGR